jgi:hypothetical protein
LTEETGQCLLFYALYLKGELLLLLLLLLLLMLLAQQMQASHFATSGTPPSTTSSHIIAPCILHGSKVGEFLRTGNA